MRDATGNVIALYEGKAKGLHVAPETIVLKETIIYGSNRIGQYRGFKNDAAQGEFNKKTALGQRIYEFSNHLQNVLVVVADFKRPIDTDNDGQAEYFQALVLAANDYYPFGMTMQNSTGTTDNPNDRAFASQAYRYGFNGKEDDRDFGDKQLIQDYGFRLYNPAIARFLSTDPLAPSYPWYTPYQFAGNMPIWASDLDGLEPNFETGISLNLSNEGLHLSGYASSSSRFGSVTPAITFTANLSLGELGTSHAGRTLFYTTFSPSLTFGEGHSDEIPINTFPSFTGTGAKNSYKYSFTIGQNFIESTGKTSNGQTRDQRTGYIGFRVGQFYFGESNDTDKSGGDGGDDFWSANVQLGYNLGDGYRLNWNLDMYYGSSNEKSLGVSDGDVTDIDFRKNKPKVINYDRQKPLDLSFNNANNSLQLVFPFQNREASAAFGIRGRSAMWPSNTMHNSIKQKDKDKNVIGHFHHLYVPYNTRSYFRFGPNTFTGF